MSVTAQERAALIEKRVRALTMMLLTRREDLLVEEVHDDIGLDHIVTGLWPATTKDDAVTTWLVHVRTSVQVMLTRTKRSSRFD